MHNNDSYTVTHPDLLLTDNGMSVLITSTNETMIKEIKEIIESLVTSSLVFNVQKSVTTENNIAWLWYISRTVDIMIIDMDTCAYVDICTALTKATDEDHLVIFLSEKHKKRETVKMLNAMSKYMIFRTISELEIYLKMEFSSE